MNKSGYFIKKITIIMGFKICFLAYGYNSIGAKNILEWFQTRYHQHEFKLTTTTDETITLKPDLVIILLLKYSQVTPYERRCVNIRDIAPKINYLNVICFNVIPNVNYDYSEFLKLIPDDIINDPNDYTKL